MRTSRATTAAPRLPIRISDARRTQILDGNGARSAGHRPGAGRPAETEFPASMSDRRLLATVERIANDPAAYRSGTVPKGRGRFVAAAHVVGSDGKRALVKVVVEPDGEGVLAAHPGGEAPPTGDVPRSCGVATTPQERVREALARARAVLPASSAGYERASPRHADSIGTLAEFEELVSQNEMEMALYALAEIARDVDAGPSCWSALDEAADFLGVRRRRRSVRSA
jgi:hypothetical protein